MEFQPVRVLAREVTHEPLRTVVVFEEIDGQRNWTVERRDRRVLDAGEVFEAHAYVNGTLGIQARLGHIEESRRSWHEPVAYVPPDVTRGRWIPVTERLPEPRVLVLTWDGDGILLAERCSGASGADCGPHPHFLHGDDSRTVIAASHWMPLPEPPKE